MKHFVWILFIGLALTVIGQDTIRNGGMYWGVPVYAWTGWVHLFVGIGILVTCAYVFFKGKWKAPSPTEEEILQAKAELDAEYEKERLRNPGKCDTEKARQAKAAADRLWGNGREQDDAPRS